MSWIMENLYIVAVIGFFLLSALGKLGKGSENKRMPNFGGEEEEPPQQSRPDRQETGPSRVDTYPEPGGDDWYETPDRGNGYSLENQELNHRNLSERDMHGEPDSMDRRMRMMQSDLDRIHSQLNRIASDVPETVVEVTDSDEMTGSSRNELAEQARNGIIWSEILGTPRGKRPLGRR